MIAIASNGFFAIYLPDNNPGTPRIAWFILAIIGGITIGFKTLRFPQKKRLKIIVYDLIYTLILISFALFSLPFGINFILGSIIAIYRFLNYDNNFRIYIINITILKFFKSIQQHINDEFIYVCYIYKLFRITKIKGGILT